jgi:glycerol-3-phosphate acyltransferase PlsY
MAKGYLAAYLARELVPAHPWVAALAGLIVILGHNHSLFLGFKGGVGTMTTAGAALALLPLGMLVSMVIGAAVLFGSRYASLGSITFAVLLPIACLIGALVGLWPAAYLLFALGSSAISLHALRANIARLRLGTERKIGQSIPQGRRDVR